MGIRVIKTAVATLTAIYAAMLLNVDNPLAAGILAIMGVDTTRWRGVRTVLARFGASAVGLGVASALFYFFGFHIWVLSVYILIAFPLVARAGFKEGIVTGAVVVFHLFATGVVSVHTISNELFLLLIGLGWATFFNFVYMPKEKKTLEKLREETELGFAAVFAELARYLRNPDRIWSGGELLATESAVEEGMAVANRARENRLLPQTEPWLLYFHMRRQQLDSIQSMMESVALASERVPQAQDIAGLFERLADDVRSDYYEGQTETGLDSLERQFKSMALPATRDEFETRAALLQLCRELRRYLSIAKREKKRRSSSQQSVIE
ncbi:aromatic acid exporter family protein [Cohnella zeiphila]|uniref:Aromatic acid exporter family protein n=1 Tax=Cohnella zeiphila TaxID=2761120 RepID=A0A7X0SI23_9BACL|nr:aromatic acid exporter family protein [Cohnella zeiphila]MBB6730378.1 aromatic acid exporter family protein [Cohnella zeiphila]